MSGGLLPVFDVAEPERGCRLRELRVTALLVLGKKSPLVKALVAAIENPDALPDVLDEIDRLPAIPKRRVLAVLATVL